MFGKFVSSVRGYVSPRLPEVSTSMGAITLIASGVATFFGYDFGQQSIADELLGIALIHLRESV